MASILGNIRYSGAYQRVNLIYQRPEVKASFEVILSVFVVSLLILAAIRPTLANVAVLQKKIDDQTATIKKADNKLNQLTELQNKMTEFVDNIALLDVAVAGDITYFEPIKRVEIIASERNIKIESIKMPSRTITGDVKKLPTSQRDKLKEILSEPIKSLIRIPFEITVSGNQRDIFEFANQVERMDRLAKIESIDVTKVAGKDTATKSRLKMELRVIFYAVREQ